MKKLILSTAFGYRFSDIRLFLESLHDLFDGKLVLFSDRKFLRESKLSYELEWVYYDVKKLRSNSVLLLNNSNNYRYALCLDWLQNNQYWDQVLMSDSRDVFFQEDPFKIDVANKLVVAQEEQLIGFCQFNSQWIRSIFSEKRLEELSGLPILCSGTTIGSHGAIIDYLEEVVKQIEISGRLLDCGEKSMVIDQGVHIDWCYRNPEKIRVTTANEADILTMGYCSYVRVNKMGQVINSLGEPYKIVHQYDRFGELYKALTGRKEALRFTNDKRKFLFSI